MSLVAANTRVFVRRVCTVCLSRETYVSHTRVQAETDLRLCLWLRTGDKTQDLCVSLSHAAPWALGTRGRESARGAALSAALPLESRDNAECMHTRAPHTARTDRVTDEVSR